jgi:HlyD family secretion protein
MIALSDINNEVLYKNEQTTLLEFERLKGATERWKNKYLFVSPINGKVSFNKFVEDNIYLNRNDNVFTIIPVKGGKVEGNAEMAISKSGKVRVGQKVNIKLANFPYGEYGMLEGKIKSISLTPSNDKYILSIELPNGLVSTYGKELNFKQNMKGIAEIITEDLRLIERVFYQFRKKVN